MQIRTSKELALAMALSLSLALGSAAVRAQTFTAPLQASTTGTNPVDFEFRADGTLIARGNLGLGTLQSADQGVGTRMLWFPAKGAFRAGTLSALGTAWNTANIGQGSVAFGRDTAATGAFSLAGGDYSTASGEGSIAWGTYALASGFNAVALGTDTSATGPESLALGYNSNAVGAESFAVGNHALANGDLAMAIGYGAWAHGYNSVALNYETTAIGDCSTAFGVLTRATSYNSFVVGRFNVGGGNATTWVATDPLFEVGNGDFSAPSDAFVVYKNGNATFRGVVMVAPGGDIPMYTGN